MTDSTRERAGNPPGRPGSLVRWVPVASRLPRYQRAWLTGDAIAGFTIWGLLIPEMIAYASLAGLPPQAGLYTLLASLALYAVFGTSRHLVSWPHLKLDDLWVLLPSAAGMMLVIFSKALGAGQTFADKHGSPPWPGPGP